MRVTRSFIKKIIEEKFYRDDFQDVYSTARMAHIGQKRKSGEDYFTHPNEVRNIVNNFYPNDRISQLAALLHDTLEDAPGSTVDSIEEMEGFIKGSITDPRVAEEVIRVVRLLTHKKSENYLSYVVSLVGDQTALRVKLSDMLHNLTSSPSPKQISKYKSALEALTNETSGRVPPNISLNHWHQLQSLTGLDSKMKITERQLRKIIRVSLLSEASIATASDIARFKPQLEEWIEILVDEMADTIPRMKEIEDKKRKNLVSSILRKLSVELIGLTSSMSTETRSELNRREKEKSHQEWDKARKHRGAGVQYYGEYSGGGGW